MLIKIEIKLDVQIMITNKENPYRKSFSVSEGSATFTTRVELGGTKHEGLSRHTGQQFIVQ